MMTLDECILALEEIDRSVRNNYDKIPAEERSMMIGVIAASLEVEAKALQDFKDSLEKEGKASKPSQEQLDRLKELFRQVAASKIKTS